MREDYRHFGARSTAKIGPAKRHHTADHHVIAKTDLRAGIVKARRPRVRAGGAKRSALHGAEHRCSIVVVMADALTQRRRCSLHDGRKSTSNTTRASYDFPGEQLTWKHPRTRPVCGQHFPDEPGWIFRTI